MIFCTSHFSLKHPIYCSYPLGQGLYTFGENGHLFDTPNVFLLNVFLLMCINVYNFQTDITIKFFIFTFIFILHKKMNNLDICFNVITL